MKLYEDFSFNVMGNIVGCQRPKVTKNITFIPAKTREFQGRIQGSYIEACGHKPLNKFGNKPLLVVIECFFKIPKSIPKIYRPLFEKGYVCCTKKPDFDNIAKGILDALTGLAFDDDSQVVNCVCDKSWSKSEEYVKISLARGEGISYQEFESMPFCQKRELL